MAVSAAAPRVASDSGSLRDGWLWFGTALYAVLYFLLGAVRYNAHRNFVDLGIFAQTASSAFGCFCNTIEGNHWAVHFSPILYLPGALMQVWRSPLALVAFQAVAGALTVPAIYGIAARHAGRGTARLTALVILLYPPLAGVIFNDFHENGLAPAAVAWLLWAFDGGYPALTILFALLVLCVKEDQALFLAIAGAIGAWYYRRDPLRVRLCGAAGVLGAFVFVVFFAAIQPHAASHAHWSPVRFYAWSAQDWIALLHGGVLARVGFLLLVLVPLLFLPFRTPAMLLAVAPLGEVLASRMPTTYTVGSHYAGAWMGWLLFAFALGIARVAQTDARRARRLLYWCIALCVVEFASADPLHPGQTLHARQPRDVALDAFLAGLPPQAALATQEEAYTHLAAIDPNVTLFPESAATPLHSCYALVDEAYPQSPRLQEYGGALRQLAASGQYRLVRRSGSILLYRSTSCAS